MLDRTSMMAICLTALLALSPAVSLLKALPRSAVKPWLRKAMQGATEWHCARMPSQREFRTHTLGSGLHRWFAGGDSSLRHRVSRTFSIWPASLSGIDSGRLSLNAVCLCRVGLQPGRIAVCFPRSARWDRRGAVLSGPSEGPTPAVAVPDCPRTQNRRWGSWRSSSVAAENVGVAFSLNNCQPLRCPNLTCLLHWIACAVCNRSRKQPVRRFQTQFCDVFGRTPI